MARNINRLTDKQVQRAYKVEDKGYQTLNDGGGLMLLVFPDGTKLWRLRYRRHGRANMLSLGKVPMVTLADARDRRDDIWRDIAKSIDPAAKRRAEQKAHADTFEATAVEWLSQQMQTVSAGTVQINRRRLERNVFPRIGSQPIRHIKALEVLKLLKQIEGRGKIETAHRVKALISGVFRYAVVHERCEHDVTAGLRGALIQGKERHFATITDPAKVGQLLRAIDGYTGQESTAAALRLAPYLFVRPGELRGAEWSEFQLDGDRPEWRIPAERMKMNDHHVVPLSTQAVAVLRELRQLTGRGTYLFPSIRTGLMNSGANARPMSNNTVNAALRRIGYSKDEITGHGFRSMASTLLNEQGWHPDVIELQLAHKERNNVRAAYNRAERLDDRRKMMQSWADYLDGLKAGPGNVVPIGRGSRAAA